MGKIIVAAIVAAILVAGAWFVAEQRETTSVDNVEFHPGILARINEVTRLVQTRQDGVITLTQDADGRWLRKERGDYPVSADQVRKFLRGFAEMRRLEAKTSDPAKYAKLAVGDPSSDPDATQVALYTADDEKIADVIFGNDRSATVDIDLREVYVRKPGEEQSWLAQSDIRILRNYGEWLDKNIMAVHRDRFNQVFVDHPGDSDDVLISRKTLAETDYALKDIPEGMRPEFNFELKDIVTNLAALDLEDVIADEDIDWNSPESIRVTIDTFDAMRIVMVTGEKDGTIWARFRAGESGRHSLKAEEGADQLLDAAGVAKEVEDLNARWEGWAYKVRNFKFDNVVRKKSDYLVPDEKAATTPKS